MKRASFAAAVIFTVLATGFAAEAKKANFQTVSIDSIREFDKKEILKKVPLDTDKFVFNTYFLEPRQLLAFHKHPVIDELFYFIEGRGQFTAGNDQVMVDSGSVVYGPANVDHGIVNSGKTQMVVISVQAPKPIKIIYAENSTITCTVCGQEIIVKSNAKDGDIYICPRCGAKLKLSKTKDGKWTATQM